MLIVDVHVSKLHLYWVIEVPTPQDCDSCLNFDKLLDIAMVINTVIVCYALIFNKRGF